MVLYFEMAQVSFHDVPTHNLECGNTAQRISESDLRHSVMKHLQWQTVNVSLCNAAVMHRARIGM